MAARWDRRSHMMSEIVAAARDGGFGPTSERGNDGLWTANDDVATTTTEVGFPPDFFPSSNRFLRFPSDLQNCCMEIVSVFFLFIEIFVSVVGIQNGSWMCIYCQGNLCFGEC